MPNRLKPAPKLHPHPFVYFRAGQHWQPQDGWDKPGQEAACEKHDGHSIKARAAFQ